MTNTIAFRVIAACSFCGRRFDVPLTRIVATRFGVALPSLQLPCEDVAEKLCCVDCLCDHCGHGHVTRDEMDYCESEHAA